jgi:hypothetical protein
MSGNESVKDLITKLFGLSASSASLSSSIIGLFDALRVGELVGFGDWARRMEVERLTGDSRFEAGRTGVMAALRGVGVGDCRLARTGDIVFERFDGLSSDFSGVFTLPLQILGYM